MNIDPKNQMTIEVMDPSTSKTANWNSSIIDLKDYVGNVAVILNAGAATAGTSPTLDVTLYSSSESNGANAVTTNVNFNQVTSTNSHQVASVDTRAARRYLKAVATIGGTNSPAFPIAMTAMGTKQVE